MEKRIIEIIEKIKGEEMSDLTAENSIVDDFRLDSLQTVNFFLNLEDEFDIVIDFENFDYKLLSSVKLLAEYIKKEME